MIGALSSERLAERRVTYTLEVNGQLHLVENVPARVNLDTGEQWFAPATVEQLQRLIWEHEQPVDSMNPYTGSDFDDFLAEEGILEEATARAHERLLALQFPDAARAPDRRARAPGSPRPRRGIGAGQGQEPGRMGARGACTGRQPSQSGRRNT